MLGLISLEIERLQAINYRSDYQADDCRHQIGVYLSMFDVIEKIKAQVAHPDGDSDETARAVEGHWQFYARKFRESLVAKSDGVVHGVWSVADNAVRVGLVFATASLGAMIGIPVAAAVSIGSIAFFPKVVSKAIEKARGKISAMAPGGGD